MARVRSFGVVVDPNSIEMLRAEMQRTEEAFQKARHKYLCATAIGWVADDGSVYPVAPNFATFIFADLVFVRVIDGKPKYVHLEQYGICIETLVEGHNDFVLGDNQPCRVFYGTRERAEVVADMQREISRAFTK